MTSTPSSRRPEHEGEEVLEGKFASVADRLFEVGAVKFGAFRIKLHERKPDAPLSPIYLNLRTPDNPKPGPLAPELVNEIAELFYQLMSFTPDLDFRYVAGLPRAGDPLADELMEYVDEWSPVTRLHLAKEETASGRRIAHLADDIQDHGIVLIVDDLITQADTKLEAIQVLEQAGLHVCDLVVLVDREQGGSDQLKEIGVRVIAAFTLSELLDHYVDTGKIERSKADEVSDYVAASRG
jgi:uridine monophosphate synthetase